MNSDILTLSDAAYLGDLIRAVERKQKMRFYPRGTDDADHPLEVTLRAFTTVNGGFYPSGSDVRDAHVWASSMVEHWFPVRNLILALSNLDGHLGFSEPIAVLGD